MANNVEQDIRALTDIESIKAYVRGLPAPEADAQRRDPNSGRFVSSNEPQTFTSDEVIGGRTFHFEAASQAELDSMILQAHRVANAVQTPQETAPAEQDEARRVAEYAAQQASEDFRAGRIEIGDWLAAQGIDLETLRQQQSERADSAEIQSWSQATEEFLKTSDWPGGERNKAIMHSTLAAMDLLDSDDRLGAMRQAYERMKELKTVFPYEDGTPITGRTPEEIAALAAAKVAQMPDVAKASPEELMAAWRVANGLPADGLTGDATRATFALSDANQKFIEQFRKR